MDTSDTHIFNKHLTLLQHVLSMLHYTKRNAHIFRHTLSMGVIGISQSILMHTSQYFYHIQFILCSFGKTPHFFHRNPWQCDFPHKIRKGKVWEPEGELIRLSDAISQDQNNDKTDLSSSTKNTLCRLITTKISKSKSISFWQKPTFC